MHTPLNKVTPNLNLISWILTETETNVILLIYLQYIVFDLRQHLIIFLQEHHISIHNNKSMKLKHLRYKSFFKTNYTDSFEL